MEKSKIIQKIKMLFTEEKFEGTDYKTIDGLIIRVTPENEVKEITEEGETAITTGDYTLEDGRVLKVVDGLLSEIVEKEEEETEEGSIEVEVEMAEYLETTLMDGTKVRVTGTELTVGSFVEVEKDGEWVKAPEGQHNLSDDRVIYVDGEGKVNEIETPDTKKEDEVDMKKDEMFSALETLTNQILTLTEKLNAIETENKELKSKFETFSKTPVTQSITKESETKKFSSKEDKIKFFGRR